MTRLMHLDLFSGIGGFALAAEMVWQQDYEIAAFCDNDPFCRAILEKHWPHAPIYHDIRTFSAEKHWRIFPPDADQVRRDRITSLGEGIPRMPLASTSSSAWSRIERVVELAAEQVVASEHRQRLAERLARPESRERSRAERSRSPAPA